MSILYAKVASTGTFCMDERACKLIGYRHLKFLPLLEMLSQLNPEIQ